MTLSSGLPDGNYDWLIGLYDSGDGSRVRLEGVDDGTSRIRLGVLHLANAGALLTFTPETGAPTFDPAAWYAPHLNNTNNVVDFGDARTDGSVWLHREGNVWLLKTWPRERNFTLELSAQRFAQPATVQSIGGSATQVIPVPSASRWCLPLNGASEYRWTNSPPRVSILRTNRAVVVSWPASADGFQLEASSDLTRLTGWAAVGAVASSSNGLIAVPLPADAPMQFLRLKQSP